MFDTMSGEPQRRVDLAGRQITVRSRARTVNRMTLPMSWDEWARHDGTALAARARRGRSHACRTGGTGCRWHREGRSSAVRRGRADDLLVTARVRVAFISGGKAQRIPKALRLAMEGHR